MVGIGDGGLLGAGDRTPGSLATGFSVSLLGIREVLLVDGLLAIPVQALIGRRWDHMPDPGSPDALSPVRGPRRAGLFTLEHCEGFCL